MFSATIDYGLVKAFSLIFGPLTRLSSDYFLCMLFVCDDDHTVLLQSKGFKINWRSREQNYVSQVSKSPKFDEVSVKLNAGKVQVSVKMSAGKVQVSVELSVEKWVKHVANMRNEHVCNDIDFSKVRENVQSI